MSDEQTRLLHEVLELQKKHLELSQRQFELENRSRNGARVGRIAMLFLLLVIAFALTVILSEVKAMRTDNQRQVSHQTLCDPAGQLADAIHVVSPLEAPAS